MKMKKIFAILAVLLLIISIAFFSYRTYLNISDKMEVMEPIVRIA